LVPALDLALPGRKVPVQRAHGHARGIALLECGDAGSVVAAEAVAHDHYLLRIDLPPRGYVFVGRGAWNFVIVTGMEPAKAQRLALPGPVDGERIPAAHGELQSREQNAHLLAVVHAVEHDHRRRAP